MGFYDMDACRAHAVSRLALSATDSIAVRSMRNQHMHRLLYLPSYAGPTSDFVCMHNARHGWFEANGMHIAFAQ